MAQLILDIECSWTKGLNDKRPNPSPYLATNQLVSVGVKEVNKGEVIYLVFNHNDFKYDHFNDAKKALQSLLDSAKVVIGHNLKFDMSWLYTCGFKYDGELYDTMIAEYVFAKGQKTPLSLDECCKRYELPQKSDVLGDYRDRGINTHEVPLDLLIEYGKNDILITEQLYLKQQELIATNTDCKYMEKAIVLMNKTLPVLIDMERNGICIDMQELDSVEKDYRTEYDKLKHELQQIVVDKMGHTIINPESPEHLSWVLYSRKVKDKKEWAELFNLGSEMRNSVRKVKYGRYMSKPVFESLVREHTEKLKKTEAKQCEDCKGKGKQLKIKKDGSPFKKETLCKTCSGVGFKYVPLSAYAGFKLQPMGSEYTATGGFSTDKITLQELLKRDNLTDECRTFLTNLLRMNSISTYLGTFVEGIKKNVKDTILHTSYNQCITATGRLSSSNPNFQNLPRAKTFPIRRVIKSRFEGGQVFSVDFKQLEFRVAAILAKDEQAKNDILNNVDIHTFTRDVLVAAGLNIDRQAAKSHTFKPLYGGIKGTKEEETYYKAFLEKYKGIDTWQKELENEAVTTKQIKSPSGRIYRFDNCRRLSNGSVTGHTQIKNYIVQGFATGDICPVALINIWHRLRTLNCQSKLILTVHDDITIDVHPDEKAVVINVVKRIFKEMNMHVESWFDIRTEIPIDGDFSIGNNWLDKETIAA